MTDAVLPSAIGAFAPARAAEAAGEPGPVQPTERIELLDVLRGFALLGILQVNWIWLSGLPGQLQSFFIEGSFRTIYSFLFGLGFAIQLIRAEEKRRPFVSRYLRRALVLFLIGGAHFVFIWRGDIVRTYAIMSVTLLLVRRWRPWMLLAFAALVLTLTFIPRTSLPGGSLPGGYRGQPLLTRPDPEHATQEQRAALLRNETWFQWGVQREHAEADGGYLVGVRAAALMLYGELRWIDPYTFIRGDLMALFLLGLYAGRRRLLHEPEKHVRLFRTAMWVGLGLGALGNFFDQFGGWARQHHLPVPSGPIGGNLTYTLGNDFLSLFYICAVVQLYLHRESVGRWLKVLAPVGRMGLTNYIMQSVILTTLLFGRGLGLGGYVASWWHMLLLQAVFVVQIMYSRWWFQRFQFGPVEWAWRSLTWGRLQPMRKAARVREATSS